MKRFLKYCFAVLLIVSFAIPSAFAGADDEMGTDASANAGGTANDTTAVPSQPRLMVYAYSLDSEYLSAGSTATLSVSVYNTSTERQIRNLKMTFSVEDNEILPVEMGTKYLKRVKANGWYEWKFDICAVETAKSGVHPAVISMEYEDSNGTAYTATDILIIRVRQLVRLSYDEPELGSRLTQGDTPAFSMTLMNTGKSTIYNAMLTFDIPGISNGGSVLVGTIEAGESKTGTTNFRVDSDTIGDVNGTILLSYEDDFGKNYTKELPVSTHVEEKKAVQAPVQADKSQLDTGQLVLIAAAAAGILLVVTVLIVRAVKKKRQREEEERTL